MIGGLVAVAGGQVPSGALVGAVAEQLFDVGLADSDPSANLSGSPAECAVDNAVRFLANPALRALSLLVAGPGGTGTAYELAIGLGLAVLPFVLAGFTTHREPPVGPVRVSGMGTHRAYPSATVTMPPAHPAAGVLMDMPASCLVGGTQMTGQTLQSVRAEALFVSDVQRSDHLTDDQVRAAVLSTVRRHGTRQLAALVAAEYGDHPETAVGRMSWAIGAIRAAYSAHEAYPVAA